MGKKLLGWVLVALGFLLFAWVALKVFLVVGLLIDADRRQAYGWGRLIGQIVASAILAWLGRKALAVGGKLTRPSS